MSRARAHTRRAISARQLDQWGRYLRLRSAADELLAAYYSTEPALLALRARDRGLDRRVWGALRAALALQAELTVDRRCR